MFRTTCRVKAFVVAGFDPDALFSSSWPSDDSGSGDGVDGRRGDPSVVLHPDDCSLSLNKNKTSSGFTALSERSGFESTYRWNLLRIHLPASRLGS